MRIVIGILAFALAASIAWRYRALLGDWAAPTAPPPKPFVFDNGTVRDQRPASQPAGPPVATTAIGAPRKCVRGSETTYTNFSCPPGFREARIADDRVTVVPGAAGTKQTASPRAGQAPSALHEALDLKRDDELRRRVMERAIEGAEK